MERKRKKKKTFNKILCLVKSKKGNMEIQPNSKTSESRKIVKANPPDQILTTLLLLFVFGNKKGMIEYNNKRQ